MPLTAALREKTRGSKRPKAMRLSPPWPPQYHGRCKRTNMRKAHARALTKRIAMPGRHHRNHAAPRDSRKKKSSHRAVAIPGPGECNSPECLRLLELYRPFISACGGIDKMALPAALGDGRLLGVVEGGGAPGSTPICARATGWPYAAQPPGAYLPKAALLPAIHVCPLGPRRIQFR